MYRTRISQNNMGFLEGKEHSPEEMADFLKDGALYRSFGDVLARVCPDEEMARRLAVGMAEITGENPESISRKVRNWLKGRNIPKNRNTLFQICFCLGLDEAQAGIVLGAAAETAIHYRNPDELVYAFALRTGRNWQEAERLRANVHDRFDDVIKNVVKVEKRPEEGAPVFTVQLRDAFSTVADEEDLMDFFREYGSELGMLHETAYRDFMRLMDYLQQPETPYGSAERKYSINEVMDTYFRMHVPKQGRSVDHTGIQKLIRKYWPNETSLTNMRNRKEDVSRKVMILLYLVTEEFDCEGAENLDKNAAYYPGYEEDEDPDTILDRRRRQMDLYLDSFGMNLLDSGNLFDYLVLYAMRGQEGESVAERMEQILGLLFEEDGKKL